MKIRVGVRFHKFLVISEEIKVRLSQPLLEALVEFPGIPRGQRNIFEQRIGEEIKLSLAHHLQVFVITQLQR